MDLLADYVVFLADYVESFLKDYTSPYILGGIFSKSGSEKIGVNRSFKNIN
jgi:hypothetical protein